MNRFRGRFALALSAFGGLICAHSVHAGSLYRCQGAGGMTVYTNQTANLNQCVVVSSWTDEQRKKPAAAGSVATRKSWDYREQPDAQAPPTVVDVRARNFGVASTAPRVAPAAVAERPADNQRVADIPTVDLRADKTKAVAGASAPVPTAVAPAAPATTAPASPRTVRGAVYRVARADGVTEFTNIKPKTSGNYALLFTYIATCVACDVHSTIDFARTALNLVAFRDVVAQAAMEFSVDAALLRAVIHAESAFNPNAVSIKGAQGLMQLMPGTASDLGVSNAFDAVQNIRGGAQYLSGLLRTFNGDEQLATAAYNAGPGAVKKYSGVPPYDETRVYVQRVATLRDRYRAAL